ncbi:MAG: single-stranded DNA-binding protein [Planctomycetota bacterium]|nr:single-stranded DNA-binding protein [Planctomycetota bacterium]
MASLNKVLLMGNLTRDVEMRYTPSGMAVAQLGLAVSRKFKDSKTNQLRDEVVFVDIDVWGKQAETANQYLSKGRSVFVEGRLKFDQWDDKQTGQKRSKLKVVAERIQFVGPPPSGQGGAPRPAQGARSAAQRPGAPAPAAPAAAAAPEQEAAAPPDAGPEDLEIPEENVPF